MRQNVLKTSACALSALAVLAFAGPSLAQGKAGGSSGTHMSTQGATNTNGPTSTDRDKGRARAQDRQSTQGKAHTKAGTKSKSGSKQ